MTTARLDLYTSINSMAKQLKHTQVAILPPVCPICNVEMAKAGGALSGKHEVQSWRCPVCHRRAIKGLRVHTLEAKKAPVRQSPNPVEVNWISKKRED